MTDTPWPRHPDGKPMTLGEMTPAQRREQTKLACQKLSKELSSPRMQKAIQDIFNNVK